MEFVWPRVWRYNSINWQVGQASIFRVGVIRFVVLGGEEDEDPTSIFGPSYALGVSKNFSNLPHWLECHKMATQVVITVYFGMNYELNIWNKGMNCIL